MNVEAFINLQSVVSYHYFTFRTAKLRILFDYARGILLNFGPHYFLLKKDFCLKVENNMIEHDVMAIGGFDKRFLAKIFEGFDY